MVRRRLVVGNWKMNGLRAQLPEIEMIEAIAAENSAVDVGLCVPATLIAAASAFAGAAFIGAQDCHAKPSGPHTGCLSATMVKESGATDVIVGHSERRTDQHETSADVRGKALAARAEGLKAILCVGERIDVRQAGHAVEYVVGQMLDSLPEGAAADWLSLAYEPLWCIGTGCTPTSGQLEEMHAALRMALRERLDGEADGIRILYGGSVTGGNAAELFAIPDVDGALVGGASLTAEKFGPIIRAAQAAG